MKRKEKLMATSSFEIFEDKKLYKASEIKKLMGRYMAKPVPRSMADSYIERLRESVECLFIPLSISLAP